MLDWLKKRNTDLIHLSHAWTKYCQPIMQLLIQYLMFYHSFALMISFISIFLEWLMFSYFLICSFITAKCQKKFFSHWVGEFYPRLCLYYQVKRSNVFYLHLLWSYFQVVTKCPNNCFFKKCLLYRHLLIKHLLISKIAVNTFLNFRHTWLQ